MRISVFLLVLPHYNEYIALYKYFSVSR